MMANSEIKNLSSNKKEGESSDKSDNTETIRKIIDGEDKNSHPEGKESNKSRTIKVGESSKSKKNIDVGSKSMDILSSGNNAEKTSLSLNLESKSSELVGPQETKDELKITDKSVDDTNVISKKNRTQPLSQKRNSNSTVSEETKAKLSGSNLKKSLLESDQNELKTGVDDNLKSNVQDDSLNTTVKEKCTVDSIDLSKSSLQKKKSVPSLNGDLEKSIEQINPINATNDLTISKPVEVTVGRKEESDLEICMQQKDINDQNVQESYQSKEADDEVEIINGMSEDCSFCNVLKFGDMVNCQNCVGILDDNMFKESIFVPFGMNADDVRIELVENGYIITGGEETDNNEVELNEKISHSINIRRSFNRTIKNVKIKKNHNKIRILGYFGTNDGETSLKNDKYECKRRKSFEK